MASDVLGIYISSPVLKRCALDYDITTACIMYKHNVAVPYNHLPTWHILIASAEGTWYSQSPMVVTLYLCQNAKSEGMDYLHIRPTWWINGLDWHIVGVGSRNDIGCDGVRCIGCIHFQSPTMERGSESRCPGL